MDKIKIANFDRFDGHRKGMMVDDVHLHTHTHIRTQKDAFLCLTRQPIIHLYYTPNTVASQPAKGALRCPLKPFLQQYSSSDECFRCRESIAMAGWRWCGTDNGAKRSQRNGRLSAGTTDLGRKRFRLKTMQDPMRDPVPAGRFSEMRYYCILIIYAWMRFSLFFFSFVLSIVVSFLLCGSLRGFFL